MNTIKPIQELYNEINQALPYLEGWCTPQKACHLAEMVLQTHPEKIVEIGVYGGKSLIPMAIACRFVGKGKVIGIDPWAVQPCLEGTNDKANDVWWSNQNLESVYSRFLHYIKVLGLEDWIEIMRMTSKDAAPAIGKIGMLSIDGNHSEELSQFDVATYVPKVKAGGFIIMDDINWATTQKAQKLLKRYCEPIVQTETYALYKKNPKGNLIEEVVKDVASLVS